MCLGIPGEVVSVDGTEARVDFGGAEKTVRVDIVGDDLAVGDYVLTHAGFAIRKIPERQVERTVELYEAAAAGGPGPAGHADARADGDPGHPETAGGDRS
jgi:hydrogenase expression/formation protein HypC